MSDIENIQFYNSSVYHEKYKVPIKNIIGTSHVDYTNKTWLEVLGGLKRFSNWTKDKLLEYVKSNEQYIGLSYAKYGNHFIISQGNHRSCLAILSGLEYIETDVSEFILDKHLLDTYNKLIELNLFSSSFDFQNVRTNDPTKRVWTLNLNNIDIYIRNQNSLDYFLELYESIDINWMSVYSASIKRFFNRLDDYFYISVCTKEDVDKLISDIILHKHHCE